VFADGGYAGDKQKQALTKIGDWTIGIIKRSDLAKGFSPAPRQKDSRSMILNTIIMSQTLNATLRKRSKTISKVS
jgi:hypothetical protein